MKIFKDNLSDKLEFGKTNKSYYNAKNNIQKMYKII